MAADRRPLTSFRLLSFDIYGTLIDWETGILTALQPIRDRLPGDHPFRTDSIAFGSYVNEHQVAIQSKNPQLLYSLALKQTYESVARGLSALPCPTSTPKAENTHAHVQGNESDSLLDEESSAFGASIGQWPAFPDTIAAMRKLKKKGFLLVPVSNVDRVSFEHTLNGALQGLYHGDGDSSVTAPASRKASFFDAVYTAQDIGSYKPDLENFRYLISRVETEFGVKKDDILHVAQSLFHDHEPAKKIGLQSVWIARGEGGRSGMGGDVGEYLNGENPRVAFGWRFDDLMGLAEAIETEERGQE